MAVMPISPCPEPSHDDPRQHPGPPGISVLRSRQALCITEVSLPGPVLRVPGGARP